MNVDDAKILLLDKYKRTGLTPEGASSLMDRLHTSMVVIRANEKELAELRAEVHRLRAEIEEGVVGMGYMSTVGVLDTLARGGRLESERKVVRVTMCSGSGKFDQVGVMHPKAFDRLLRDEKLLNTGRNGPVEYYRLAEDTPICPI